jgi:hypothetical protein
MSGFRIVVQVSKTLLLLLLLVLFFFFDFFNSFSFLFLPQVISIPSNLTDTCYTSIDDAEAGVIESTTFTDPCTSRENLDIDATSTVTQCHLRVKLVVADEIGLKATSAVTVRVDTQAPHVQIRSRSLQAQAFYRHRPMICYRTAEDARNAVVEATEFVDNCTPRRDLVPVVTSTDQGDPCQTTVTVNVTDSCGLVGTDSIVVRVDDTKPTVN